MRGNGSVRECEGRLDRAQPERLHSIAIRRKVCAFDRDERGLDVNSVRNVGTNEIDELPLVLAETLLAVPERVIGIECNNLKMMTHETPTGAMR